MIHIIRNKQYGNATHTQLIEKYRYIYYVPENVKKETILPRYQSFIYKLAKISNNLHNNFAIIPQHPYVAVITDFLSQMSIVQWNTFRFLRQMLWWFDEDMIPVPVETSNDKIKCKRYLQLFRS